MVEKSYENIWNRIGLKKENKNGYKMRIIEVDGSKIKVYFFDSKEIKESTWVEWKRGTIKPNYSPSIFGVGIVGEDYSLIHEKDNKKKQLRSYITWKGMLERCYTTDCGSSYEGCSVCDEWLYYPNFKKWYDSNYYDVNNGERMHLDKDILHRGNRIYSPENCMFVPNKINIQFKSCGNVKYTDLPTGITIHPTTKGYTVSCGNKRRKYGVINLKEAIQIYYKFKKELLEEVLSNYEGLLSEYIYNFLHNYDYTEEMNEVIKKYVKDE